MLLRTLVLTVLMICAAPLCAAQWPCPEPDAIKPCNCTGDADLKLFMDCSGVPSDDRLKKIFQTNFPFNDFQELVIKPKDASDSLQVLSAGVFGEVSFSEIDISNTKIHTVEEQALVHSHNTLTRLNLQGNEISSFTFETLDLFTKLVKLDLSYNKLSGNIADIVSDTLITLDMSGNTGLRLTGTAFQEAPFIEELNLNALDLGTTAPPDVFRVLKNLAELHLDNNGITGELIENLINPELKPLTTLGLTNNKITQLHPQAVTGMKAEGTVQLQNNEIEYLHQENWDEIVSQLTKADAIDVTENPLVCGCDVMWLVFDTDLMAIFHKNVTCITGIKLTDLPKDWFAEHCP